jgi:Ca-activated chloride channel homolog
MTFSAPLWLAGLALIPVAVAVAIAARRRAKRYAVRFPAISTLRLAAGGATARRRHLPAALALAALAALVLALARPHVSYRAPVRAASVMLVSDESGSMASTDVQPTRLAAAERAANSFVDRLPSDARVGAIAFSSAPNAVQAPAVNHAAARAIIDGQSAGGGTATGNALELALELLHGGRAKHPASAIVLLSDGDANAGINVLTVSRQAGAEHIPIYTVALGTPSGTLPNPEPFAPPFPVPPDPQLMQAIAQDSHGRSFGAQTADQLASIYRHLGTRLGSATRKREVTALFAIAGLALLLVAAATSSRWSPRLP